MALFETEPRIPVPGFSYQDGFLSEEEERGLIDLIGTIALTPFIFQGFEAKRKTKSFGYDYHFDSRKLTAGEPIPEGFNFITERVANYLGVPRGDIAELLITEYP